MMIASHHISVWILYVLMVGWRVRMMRDGIDWVCLLALGAEVIWTRELRVFIVIQ